MNVYKVGELYNPRKTKWPEVAQYNYRGGEHELVVFLRDPVSEEVEAVRTGKASFGLYATRTHIILLYEFAPGLPWSDAPFTIWRVSPSERTIPQLLDPGHRILLPVTLVNCETGIVMALRVTTLSAEFSSALTSAIIAQSRTGYDAFKYNKDLDSIYRKYTTTQLLGHCIARSSQE